MSFRLNCKNFFLTWPKCEFSKEQCLENIKNYFTEEMVSFAIVAQEKHADGDEHLHAVVSLKKRKDIRSANVLDQLVGGKHGDYKSCRNLISSVRYVVKDSQYVVWNLNVEEYLSLASKKQNTKSAIVAGQLMDGKSLSKINQENPGFVMMNLRKIQEYQAFLALIRIREDLLGVDMVTWELLEGYYNRTGKDLPGSHAEIMSWLLNSVGNPGRIGDKHLWVFGNTGLQKTSFFTRLAKYYSVYWPPRDENFYNNYSDDCYDLVVFDEFRGNKDIQFMNNFLDGSPMTLRTKGGQVVKRRRIPTVVLSNFSISHVYRVCGDLSVVEAEAIARRFIEVEINEPLEMLSDEEARASSEMAATELDEDSTSSTVLYDDDEDLMEIDDEIDAESS